MRRTYEISMKAGTAWTVDVHVDELDEQCFVARIDGLGDEQWISTPQTTGQEAYDLAMGEIARWKAFVFAPAPVMRVNACFYHFSSPQVAAASRQAPPLDRVMREMHREWSCACGGIWRVACSEYGYPLWDWPCDCPVTGLPLRAPELEDEEVGQW